MMTLYIFEVAVCGHRISLCYSYFMYMSYAL